MSLEKIKENVEKFLKEKDYKLFEIKYLKKDETLSILLDEKLDMDELETISNQLSTYLDEFEDEFDNNYILDVSTVGIERPIRNIDELKKAIGEYIYVKTKDGEFTGTLKEFEDNKIILECIDKTKVKNVELDYAKTSQVRYAVKF